MICYTYSELINGPEWPTGSKVLHIGYDLGNVRRSKDTEEEFWAMVRKLQYYRSASNGSIA